MKKAMLISILSAFGLAIFDVSAGQAYPDGPGVGSGGVMERKVAQQVNQSPETVTTASGLKYQDKVVGQGARPRRGQTVIVHYTGWLTNGEKFDSSVDRGQPFNFSLGAGQVIRGWDEGVASMRVGGIRRLIIPPYLGYGARGAGGAIPPNATLIFDVQLLGIQ